jgi:hypothetical protein
MFKARDCGTVHRYLGDAVVLIAQRVSCKRFHDRISPLAIMFFFDLKLSVQDHAPGTQVFCTLDPDRSIVQSFLLYNAYGNRT